MVRLRNRNVKPLNHRVSVYSKKSRYSLRSYNTTPTRRGRKHSNILRSEELKSKRAYDLNSALNLEGPLTLNFSPQRNRNTSIAEKSRYGLNNYSNARFLRTQGHSRLQPLRDDSSVIKFRSNEVRVRLMCGTSCINDITVQELADLYVKEFQNGNMNWKACDNFSKVTSSERLSELKQCCRLLKNDNNISYGTIREIEDLFNTNLSSLALKVQDEKGTWNTACVCLFSLHVTNAGCRSLCCLNLIYTKPELRRRGLGLYGIAICKDFTRSHPALTRQKIPDSSFLWCRSNDAAFDFFMDEKVAFDEGWSDIQKLVPNECLPSTYSKETPVHCMMQKGVNLGDYMNSAIAMEEPPTNSYTLPLSSRAPSHASVPSFVPGSMVIVKYPQVISQNTYAAMVLDYNPHKVKPYLIQYESGFQHESVIPQRIVSLSSSSNDYLEKVVIRGRKAKKSVQNRSEYTSILPSHDLLNYQEKQIQG